MKLGNIFEERIDTQKNEASSQALPEIEQRFNSVIESWFHDKGDETLRLNYTLNENSIVFDLGGYKGDWTASIFLKYACNIYVFEPVPIYAEEIRKRFYPNPKIRIYPVGLGDKTCEVIMSVMDTSSSLYRPGDVQISARIQDISDFFVEHYIDHVDLMKINIEGGEYDLLDHLIVSGLIKLIKNVQVQFHRDFPNAEERMNIIQQEMAQTHTLTYQYKFVWENWSKK